MKSGWKAVWGGGVLVVVLALVGYVPAGAQRGSNEQVKTVPAGRDAAHKPLAVSLLNGVTVELVGVCTSPARGLQWWVPDGSPLPSAPYEGWDSPSARQWARERGGEPNYYEIALRVVYEGSEPVTLEWEFARGYQGWLDLGTHPEPDLRSVFIVDQTRAAPMDFRVAVATGPWKTACVYPRANQRSDFEETELGEHAVIWQSPVKPEENYPGKLKLNVIHDYKGDCEVRVVAVDERGEVHQPIQTKGNFANRLTVLRSYYDLEPQEVREFQLQVRPLYWAYFQNVSLRPGGRTNPTAARKPPQNIP